MTLLAQNAQIVLDQALAAEHGTLVRIHTIADMVQPSKYGRQVLYHFKSLSPDYEALVIHIMSDNELWIIH
jgi:hypothetical protein